jgi:hypothetical protein
MPTTVNWAIWSLGIDGATEREETQLVFQEPENLLKHLLKNRAQSRYLKCYASIDALRNIYVIKAPLDITISYDRERKWLGVDGIDQQMYNLFVLNRAFDFADSDPVLSTFFPRYVFYADSPVKMAVLPTPLLGEVHNSRVVAGSFDISKWVRPVDWTFEFVDDKQEIVVKRGDPLFSVHFFTPDDSPVELQRVPFTKELKSIGLGCTKTKRLIGKKMPLKKCYEMAESLISMWRAHRGKM